MKHRAWTLLLLAVGSSAWAAEPIITTLAGGGSVLGDGGSATAAQLVEPTSLAIDAAGNVYVAEGADTYTSCRVRKVDRAGTITTFAGNGTRDVQGENVPATSVSVCGYALAVDASGNLYIGEQARIRRVTPNGIISTFAGTGVWGFAGDGGLARNAQFGRVADLAFDTSGRLYVTDNASGRIRRIGTNGVIQTIAGNGEFHASGDGGSALSAGMAPRGGVAVDAAGNVFFTDISNDTVRRVAPNGIVTRVAGNGPFRSDPLAINADLYYPRGMAFGANGNLYVTNEQNLVHAISPAGILQVVAGAYNDSTFDAYGAPGGYYGDGGPATSALLYRPQDIAVDGSGNLYVADTHNHRVRRITPVAVPRAPHGVDAFLPRVTYEVGRHPLALALGDFNRDLRVDVVVVTGSWTGESADPTTDYRLNVFLQQSDGTLAAPVRLAFPTSRHVGQLLAHDLNHDGYDDVVLATEAGLNVFLSGPTGLRTGTILRGEVDAEVPSAFLVGHVDADTHPDLVAWMGGQSEGGTSANDRYGITVFYGNGLGGMSRRKFFPQATGYSRMAWADVDRDGRSDLLATWREGRDQSGLAMFYHDGVDGFRAPQIVRADQGMFGQDLATGDFDGDGALDVIISRAENAPNAMLAHYRQTPANTLAFVSTWKTYDVPTELLGRDINGDGRDDLLIVHSGWSSVGYQPQLPALATSWLDTEVKYYVNVSGNTRPGTMAAGDLNGDGCTDVAFSDYNWDLQVLYSKRCFHAPPPTRSPVPPATATTAVAASAGALPGATTSTNTATRSSNGTNAITQRLRQAATGMRASVRRASTREVASWSAIALFLLVMSWRLPLLRRRW